MFVFRIFFYLIFVILPLESSEIPHEHSTLTLSLTRFTLQQLKNQFFPILYKKLFSMNLPDIQKESWEITITLSQLKLYSEPIDASFFIIDFKEDLLFASLNDFDLELVGVVSINSLTSYETKIHFSLKKASFEFWGKVSVTEAKKFNLKVIDLILKIGEMQLNFEGNYLNSYVNNIISLFKKMIEKQIQSSIKQKISPLLNEAMNKIPYQYVSKMQDFPFGVDWQAKTEPKFYFDHVEISIDLIFNPVEYPKIDF